MGVNPQIEIDYRTLAVEKADVFLLATDGVYEHVSSRFIAETINRRADDLDCAAKTIVEEAHRQGSPDNLTVQIVRIDDLPESEGSELVKHALELPCPPLLEARMVLDGYQIVREVHGSSRSHIYLAVDQRDGALVAIKTPSIDLRADPAYLQRFMMEEWVARRINSPHVLKPRSQSRTRNYLYVVTEFVEGQTLTQWMIDNPKPSLEAVRRLIEQIAGGLQAFHRMEMLHQDLRPENIMIDGTGTAKIIDFGSTRIAGIAEDPPSGIDDSILGTVQYTAPEYFLGEGGSRALRYIFPRSHCLSDADRPASVWRSGCENQNKVATEKTRYRSVLDDNREIPAWIDGALRKARAP